MAHVADLRVVGTEQQHVDNAQLLAMGSDVFNTQIGYAMLNTLFLREHNRIARELAQANRSWDEDRLFYAPRTHRRDAQPGRHRAPQHPAAHADAARDAHAGGPQARVERGVRNLDSRGEMAARA